MKIRRVLPIALVLAVALAATTYAAGLDAKVVGFKQAGSALRVRLEVKNAINERWRQAVETGGTLYVKIEVELWEHRFAWDSLVTPAVPSLARITSEPGSHSLVVVDPFGTATTYPSAVGPFTILANLCPIDRLNESKSYYVHARIALGSLGEGEISGVSDAIFGEDAQSGGLGSLGKMVFRKALGLADYFDSVSCEATSARIAGKEIKAQARK